MSLVYFKDVSLEFGDQRIFSNASFSIEPDERVCLIGRNGAGKSTLINIISGGILPDDGEIHIKPNLRISQLQQTLPSELNVSVYDYVKGGLSKLKTLIDTYHKRLEAKSNDMKELQSLQQQIDKGGG